MVPSEYEDAPMKYEIEKYYSGKCVFITGATGFVGKVLLSRLLQTCPHISEVLLLIRPTKTANSNARFEKLMQSSAFDLVRDDENAVNKIRVVDGNVTSPSFGLSDDNLKKVIEDTSIVFHCAASVRFQDDAKKMLSINLVGVKNLLELCHQMLKLEALVHVSTAYSFCNRPLISEEVYPEKMKPSYLIEALKWLEDDQMTFFSDYLSSNRPSLYQFSKAMAEILISENRRNLPVIIVRPSIITGAFRDPYPGWIDNINGPSGFIALSSKGILRTLLVKPDVNADWVPVDVVANTLILSAHFVAEYRSSLKTNLTVGEPSRLPVSSSDMPVVNCVCPESNMTTWSQVVDWCVPLLSKYPSIELYRPPGGFVTSSVALHNACKCVFHYLPASIVDFALLLLFEKTKMISTYRRIHGAMTHLQLYSSHKFLFTSANMRHLIQMYSSINHIFPINQNGLKWDEYIENYVHGVRRFCLKEDDSTLPLARKNLTKLWLFWKGSELLLVGFLVFCLHSRFKKLNFNLASTPYAVKIWNRFQWMYKASA